MRKAHKESSIQEEMILKKAKDRWAFLEEIEAPMWVDLNTEIESADTEIDDEWFQISHQFHQSSSHQLKLAFSHFGTEHVRENGDFQDSSSPQLPPSVSRSRGKDYKSRTWGKDDCGFSLNKDHPVRVLGEKTSKEDSGTGQERKHKSSYGESVAISSTKPRRTCGIRLENPKNTSGYGGKKVDGEKSTSTITSESIHQQEHKASEVSSRVFGQTSGLLSVLKVNFRRSVSLRQASRMEINNGRQNIGRNSSTGKSSVGSSSNLGYSTETAKVAETKNREKKPEIRNYEKMTQTAKNRVNIKPTRQDMQRITDCLKGVETGGSYCTYQEGANLKNVHQTVQRKALASLDLNQHDCSTNGRNAKSKVGVSIGMLSGLTDGRENEVKKKLPSQRSERRVMTIGGKARIQKTDSCLLQKDGTTEVASSKGMVRGQTEGRSSRPASKKVYLR